MAKKILGISFGRKMSNCDIMVKHALMQCEKAGYEVSFIRADDLNISNCTGCIACVIQIMMGKGRGYCVRHDDFDILDECVMQSDGLILFFEKMFESRIYFVDRLIAMGANAVVCDPHRVVISGPAKLRPLRMSSPDIRAGMAMIIAACCARGRSTIQNVDTVFRGYENLMEKLRALGVPAELI